MSNTPRTVSFARTWRAISWLLAITAVLVAPLAAEAGPRQRPGARPQRIDKAIRSLSETSDGKIKVIVKARAGRGLGVAERLKKRGARPERALAGGDAFAASLTPEEMSALESEGGVEGFSLDAPVYPSAVTRVSLPMGSALRTAVGAPRWSSGYGIGVAVIDSGIAPVSGIATRISAFYDFTSGTPQARRPFDGYGHGTHVAGIIAGLFADDAMGVAPGARLIGLRVLDNQGRGSTSAVIEALDFAVERKAVLGIDVINLSLGHPVYESAATDPLVLAVERAIRAGIVVVVSAGNIGQNPATGEVGYGGITSPGNAPSAITVGSSHGSSTVTRADDRVSDFSSRGPTWFDGGAKPDLVAPGQNVVSARAPRSVLGLNPALNVRKTSGRIYTRLSGTSMAAPVVSGVVALVLEASRYACPEAACPPLSPKAVKALLQYTATPLSDGQAIYNALVQGRGEVNAAGAVAVARAIDTRVGPGAPWLVAPLPSQTTVADAVWPWSLGIIWGTRALEGNVLAENELAWSDTIVWGTSMDLDTIVWGTSLDFDTIVWGTSFDDTIVWGTNVVWDDTIVWGTSIVWGSSLVGAQSDDTIVWGTSEFDADTIVWGTADFDTIVWGTSGEPKGNGGQQ